MNLTLLNEKFENCSCGRKHICLIDYVKIGKGAINTLPLLCKKYNSILLVCDNNTYRVCGKNVETILAEKISNRIVLESNGDVVIPNEEKISEIESGIQPETGLIIGVGSGVINDLCKYVSFKHNLEYFIVATAPSMDGYASVGAALILKGMKVTINARPPKAIIGDTDVLKNAPQKMLQAGYGDIIGKYSCLNDWKLSALINNEYFCDNIYNLTLSQTEKVKPFAHALLNKNEEAVESLMEALVTVGIAMSYVGNSRPASGSEHHLSHYFEITGILENKDYYSHGIDVMYSTAITAKIRENIINSYPSKYIFSRDKWISDIKRIYLNSADEVISLQDKIGWYTVDERNVIEQKWDKIINLLKEAPSFSECTNMLLEIGLSYSDFIEFYGIQKIKDAVLYAKDLKDRYTVLWLNYKYFKGEFLK
ncbi:MAG: sn-glycerol-1-phosphate dehydrogenase [Clostridia bacterium]|nr:sn-glycerol-1-phosphate dehydrogenase [Clostridia bacterium]